MANTVRYQLEHVTRYRYGHPVRTCSMSLALKPVEERGQRVTGFSIETKPAGSLFQVSDWLGNVRHQLHIYREHRTLEITSRCSIEVGFEGLSIDRCEDGAWQTIRGWRESFHHRDFLDHSDMARPSPALERFTLRNDIRPLDDPLESLNRLSDLLFDRFEYVPGSTSSTSTIDRILESGRGVCQDYAHVMISIARTWGIPARYVSGYFHDETAAGGEGRGMTSHAWVECLLPGLGWMGFDPTNASPADERHVRLAVGRDFQDVSPTHGVLQGGGEIQLEVRVAMQPLAPADPAHSIREESCK